MTARIQLGGAALAAGLAAILAVLPACGETPAPAATAQTADNRREASLAEYRQHLVELNAVVEACAKARDAKTCDPALAGQDDTVPLGNAPNAERRLVRYDWLRVLLEKAQSKDEVKSESQNKGETQSKAETQNKVEIQTKGESENKGDSQNKDNPPAKPPVKPVIGAEPAPAEEPTRPPKPTTSELLKAAGARLAQDIAQADGMAAGAPAAAADHTRERATMKEVLAGRDFRNLEAPTARDSALEKLGAWLNRLFESLGKLQAGAAWVGRAIVWGFYLAVCVGLVWGLMQLERRWRIRLVPESEGPAAGAASARDWQLWLKDSRRAAAAGQWREAIHFVYWAAISRLEARRLWPADRARTPREYLALVAPEDPRRAGLARLTGSFERVWYGGRAAGESDYQKAEELAGGLISGQSTAGAGAAEGGAR
ncbi:MAG: DUF4129 domain-containing protein [Terracidiphilus sp.]